MKKYRLVILLAVIAAALIFVFFPSLRGFFPAAGRSVVEVVSLPRVRDIPLETLVPARAVLMIRLRSAEAAWEKLTAGRAFRDLKASPLWREEKIEQRLAAAAREFEDRTGFGINRSRIMEVAGKDIVLAVIPSGGSRPPAVLALARLGTRARLMDIFLRLGDSLKAEEERFFREEIYRGEKIVSVSPQEFFPAGAAYAVIDGYLAAAASGSPASLIREVIDLARGEGDPLSGYPEFSAVLDRTGFPPGSFLECYLSPGRFPSGLAAEIPAGPAAEAVAWGEVFVQSLSSCRTIGCRVGYREGIHTRLRIAVAEEGRSVTPARSPGDRLPLPAGEMLYAYLSADPAAAASLAGLLEALGFRSEDGDFPGLAGWEKESGISLRRDILPVLGGRFGLVCGGLTGEEFIPLPPWALVIAVSDREAAAAAMDSAIAWAVLSRGLRPSREVQNGEKLTFFPGFFFSDPGYAFSGGELVIAGSREMLKKASALPAAGRPPVESDPLFGRATAGLDPAAGLTLYLDGEIFLSSFRAAADWYFARQRLAPDKPILPESVYRERILPLLDLLQPVRAAAAALGREKNIVKTDCFLYIPEQ